MGRWMGWAVAAAVALAGTVPVVAAEPVGIWQIETRDSRYDVTWCGDDAARELCVELIWLGNGGDRPENLPYLNTMVIENARPTKPNEWRGTLHLYGQTADGTIRQVSDDQVTITGCFLVVVCRSYEMFRYED